MKRYLKSLPFLLVAVAFGAACWAQQNLPERLAVHWNASGLADGYGSKFTGVWLLPLIMAVLLPLIMGLVRLDPKYSNIKKFETQWFGFMAVLEGLLLYIYLLTLAWNDGRVFDFSQAMALGFAGLCLGLSWLVGNAHQNYSIGIRTPWTLASEKVWDETHALAGKLYLWAAILAFMGFLWSDIAFILTMVGLVGASLAAVIYSYISFRRSR